jgi:hypothetical protein
MMSERNCRDDDFANYLTKWAETIRKGYAEGALDKIVSTRRLLGIVKGYAVFRDKEKAVRLSLNRFDRDTQEAFWNLYTKIDPTINPIPVAEVVPSAPVIEEVVKQTTMPTTVSI